MLTIHEGYFILNDEESLDEYYFWSDIVRVGYYIKEEESYYLYPHKDSGKSVLWLILEHATGEYIRIPQEMEEWSVMVENIAKNLALDNPDWIEETRKAPKNQFIVIYESRELEVI